MKSLELYEQLLRIRMIEEKLIELYPLEEMKTPTHFSLGEEAISVGVCASLRKNDFVTASHRCHAAYLAKGGSLKEMVAELYGKDAGACRGRAGSAHLSSPKNNMFAAPILGDMVPVAVGAALSFKMDKSKNVAVAFFGDAAIEEGVVAESINFAIIKKLPVLFVCENNLFSTHTPINLRQPNLEIYKRIKGLGISTKQIDGNDLFLVQKTTEKLIKDLRKGKGPFFLECLTYRMREHVGPEFDFYNPYRSRADYDRWLKKCPLKRAEKSLTKRKVLTDSKIKSLKSSIHREIEAAVRLARKSPWPKVNTITDNVY